MHSERKNRQNKLLLDDLLKYGRIVLLCIRKRQKVEYLHVLTQCVQVFASIHGFTYPRGVAWNPINRRYGGGGVLLENKDNFTQADIGSWDCLLAAMSDRYLSYCNFRPAEY